MKNKEIIIEPNHWYYPKSLFDNETGYFNKYLVHPDDYDLIQKEIFLGYLKCVSKEENYSFYKSKYFSIRLKDDVISHEIPIPCFEYGDEVIDLTKEDCLKGFVYDIIYHAVKKEYMYFIKVNSKEKSRRYFSNELRKIDCIL